MFRLTFCFSSQRTRGHCGPFFVDLLCFFMCDEHFLPECHMGFGKFWTGLAQVCTPALGGVYLWTRVPLQLCLMTALVV